MGKLDLAALKDQYQNGTIDMGELLFRCSSYICNLIGRRLGDSGQLGHSCRDLLGAGRHLLRYAWCYRQLGQLFQFGHYQQIKLPPDD